MRKFVLLLILACVSGVFFWTRTEKISPAAAPSVSVPVFGKPKAPKNDPGRYGNGEISTPNAANPQVAFEYYIPENSPGQESIPVLINIPGLNGKGRCRGWSEFAAANGFVVVSPSFRFDRDDWDKRVSYQYPHVWSGQALIDMVDYIHRKEALSLGQLYLVGHSAGAQVAQRFALWAPELTAAAAVHAAGGVTLPDQHLDIDYFVTVGENDIEHRRNRANALNDRCLELGISVLYQVYPGVGHNLSREQVDDTKRFFIDVITKREG